MVPSGTWSVRIDIGGAQATILTAIALTSVPTVPSIVEVGAIAHLLIAAAAREGQHIWIVKHAGVGPSASASRRLFVAVVQKVSTRRLAASRLALAATVSAAKATIV